MNNTGSYRQLDKWDYIIATSSGAITAAMDMLWVKDIDLRNAHTWGVEKINDFVLDVAKKQGYKGNELSGAIKHLEEIFPIPADKLTNDFGGGKQHHLRDFSHHPTIAGLVFSIITQFTGNGYGTDVTGKLIPVEVPKDVLCNGGPLEKLYAGIVSWTFHMISDIAGSSSSVAMGKEGTGLPGPLMSFLKELSSIPGIKNIAGEDEKGYSKFSVYCSKLFNGTLLGEHDENGKIVKGGELKFDLRTELGIGHEALSNKQFLPVLINELIVRGFYSIRRFISVLKDQTVSNFEDLMQLDPSCFLPWKSTSLTHMLIISSTTFSVIDISSAGIKAALKNKNNKAGFAIDFIQGINLFGTCRLAIATGGEIGLGIEKLHEEYLKLANAQIERIGLTYDEAKSLAVDLSSKAGTIAGIGTPIGFVSAAVQVYKEISVSLDEYQLAKENRTAIEQKCTEAVAVLIEEREQINLAVSQYMDSHLLVFSEAFDDMKSAIMANDVDLYISGNKKIQEKLGRTDSFGNMSDFDALMASTDDFKL